MSTQQEPLKVLRTRTLGGINQGKKRTHTFTVEFTDINPEFTGAFTVHHPTQLERLSIGVLKSNLLGGLSLDAVGIQTDNLATIISTLDVVLDKKPDWFDVDNDELEYEILEQVFMEYVNWMNTFRRGHREE